MFYLKVSLVLLWLFFLSFVALIYSLIAWGSPKVGPWFARWFVQGATQLLGVKVNVEGIEKLKAVQPCIACGNHQSNFDIVTHAHCFLDGFIAIGKRELLWIPLWGWLFKTTGNILLDRKNPEKAKAGIDVAKEALIQRGRSIYIFPEGTRSHGNTIGPFKKGAFHMAVAAQVPIVPIVASTTMDIFDETKRICRRGVVTIRVLDPIETKGMTYKDIESLLEKTRNIMIEEHKKIQTIVF